MHTYALTPVEPVITNAELADWLGVDSTDSLLPMMAESATSAAIEYLQSELISRQRKVIYQVWPSVGTDTSPSLSRNNVYISNIIELPYSRLLSVEEVKQGGTDITDYTTLDTLPASLKLESKTYSDDDEPAIEALYTAGYGAIADVPATIKMGVSQLAAYLYEHRGACAMSDALNTSGAAMTLAPYKTFVVML